MKKSLLQFKCFSLFGACILGLSVGNALATPISPPAALQPAISLDFSSGLGMGSGSVSTGHSIFSFEGTAGDMASIVLDVTSFDPSTLLGSDEAGVFLFGGQGEFLSNVYDTHQNGHFDPTIEYLLNDSGTYYVGVVTNFNRPSLDTNGIIYGWKDTGRNNIEFELSVNGVSNPVPEPATMLLFGIGLAGFGGVGLRKKLA